MKKSGLVLVALMLVAFLLRLYGIDAVSLRGDEAFTVIFVQRTWDGLWKGIRLVEPNPPLLYLALRAWVALAGASEFATRFFSAFFGVLCVPLVYRLARELLRGAMRNASTVALIAAWLVAINPYQVWHSQDVRNYTLWPALSLGGLALWWLWWKSARQGRIALLVLYFLVTTASLYTHYYDTFVLVAENVFVYGIGLLQRRWGKLVHWTLAQAALALVYVPWVLWGTNRVQTYGEGSAEQSVPLIEQFTRTLSTLVLGDTVPEELKSALWPLFLIIALSALVFLVFRRGGREQASFLALYVAVPTLALYAISIGRPLFLERYLNVIAPAYYILFAVALVALWQWPRERRLPWGAYAGAAGLVLFAVTSGYALANYYADPAYAKAPDWRGLAKYIYDRAQSGDIIVENFNEMAPQYYMRGATPIVTVPRDFWPSPADEKSLEQLNQQYHRIWFIPADPELWDPQQFVERYLSRHDERTLDTTIASLRVQLYATPVEFQSRIQPVNARIGQATLVGYRIAKLDGDETRLRGDSLTVYLYWRPLQKIDRDLTVFVHLMNADQRVAAQRDSVPVNGTWPTRDWLPGELLVDTYSLPLNGAAGTLSLVAGMYDSATQERIPAWDANGSPIPDNSVPLTQVTTNP